MFEKDKMYTLAEVSAGYDNKISPNTVRHLIKSGRIEAFKIPGSKYLIKGSEAAKILEPVGPGPEF